MKRRLLKRKDIDHAWTEHRVFEKTRDCPFLVQLHYAFLSNERLHLVMDYVAGKDFIELLVQRGWLTENEARFFSAEVILALQHLHEVGNQHSH
ncbi:ribosomal protein S6 kinase alpha-5-like [Zootermopsis nevadensis]|uniref:Ribosomal protein S6 kinase alpha-4 n=1 Tax=Zootermopsis nevadensis TaxID=136037 RepID=A0A067QQ39_ZOONE|nr:ribosomal protein S6 kinase alpha-5-like [Zootermopsis nevadensis]XP_021933871.1 ribosomal protein S6 kinase alpha-5-like [Zootermopsis nevadensis]KDR11860.1 Ribosomal protein S6 kinase alpha-4 [Zootermopsis nevadensis]